MPSQAIKIGEVTSTMSLRASASEVVQRSIGTRTRVTWRASLMPKCSSLPLPIGEHRRQIEFVDPHPAGQIEAEGPHVVSGADQHEIPPAVANEFLDFEVHVPSPGGDHAAELRHFFAESGGQGDAMLAGHPRERRDRRTAARSRAPARRRSIPPTR